MLPASRTLPRRHRGAVAVVVAVCIVVLVAMIGLVLDLAHVFIVKNELQNAADACALSGAEELRVMNPASVGALERATDAAVAAGQANRVDLQRDAVAVDGMQEVTFSANFGGPWAHAVDQYTRYVRCAPHETNLRSVVSWFMQVVGIKQTYLSADGVAKVAIEAYCAIPIAMCSLGNGSDLVAGHWYSGLLGSGTATTGMYDWVTFPGMTGGSDISAMLASDGMCGLPRPMVVDGKGGGTGGASQAWNTRFGLYGGGYKVADIATYRPDRTGFAYTPGTWPAKQDAYPDFMDDKRKHFVPYTGGLGGNLPGGANAITSQLHQRWGKNRRMVMVPVINCHDWEGSPNKKNLPVIKWACGLMISPVTDPKGVQLEYHGDDGSPACVPPPEGHNPVLVK